MTLKVTDTVQDAILLFTSTGHDVLQVENLKGDIVGVFTLSDANAAIQDGKIDAPIEQFMNYVILDDYQPEVQQVKGNEYSKLIQSRVFSDIINSLYDGIYITDGNGVTVKINHAYERITGLKAKQVLGYHMEDLVKLGYISKSVSIEVIKQKRPITLMQTIKNERKIIVSGKPIYDEDGRILYVINNVRDITELLRLKHEIEELQEFKQLREKAGKMHEKTYDHVLDSIVTSEETLEVYRLAERVAKTDVKVLIQGETGVGKTLIAKYIHAKSHRSQKSFLELNCGSIPSHLIESELFGYEKGAFTGASAKGKKGLLELAHGGTLFLDEVGDLPLELQVKLLKVIEEGKFFPIGSTELKIVDVRIIAASHKDLNQMIRDGRFREDLYYRLSVIPIKLPPLRRRKREIPLLVQYYLDKFNSLYGENKKMSIEALDMLTEYQWPGNIRELINVMERVVITSLGNVIDIQALPEEVKKLPSYWDIDGDDIIPLKEATERVERRLIMNALKKYKTTRKAAAALHVSQATVVQKMKKWNISD